MEKAADNLTIREIARQSGLQPSAIRYYESLGLLPRPRRVSGQRRYDKAALTRLKGIQGAQRAGFTLAEIKTLFNETEENTPHYSRWHELADRKMVELDQEIARVQNMKQLLEDSLNCNCASVDECVLIA